MVLRALLAALVFLLIALAQPPRAEIERALAADPRNPELHSSYGILLQEQGRTADAIAHFRRAVELAPRSPDFSYNLALALLHDNQAGSALAALDKHPFQTADHLALRGAVLSVLGRFPQAIEALRRSVALDSNNPDSLYDLALTLIKTGNAGEGATLLDRGRQRFPRIAKFHAAAGAVAYDNGRNDEAVRAYQVAVKLEPDAADLYASLGDIYDATGDLARAQSAYAKAVSLEPANPSYHLKQGRNFVKLQRPSDAQAAFLKAIARDATLADAHFQLGKIAAARSDHAGAVPHFERAVAADPALKEAWYQLSLSHRRAGDAQKAAAALERFRQLQ